MFKLRGRRTDIALVDKKKRLINLSLIASNRNQFTVLEAFLQIVKLQVKNLSGRKVRAL